MCLAPKFIEIPKTEIHFFPDSQRFLKIPCLSCKECRISYAKNWALRCYLHYVGLPSWKKDCAYFVTLTFDSSHNDGKLDKRDFQLFMKRLRKQYKNVTIKYFCCGEYGTKFNRPHYHCLLFGLKLLDLQKLNLTSNKDVLYTSKFLEKIWGKGYVCIGEVNFRTCFYTARYCIKKNISDCFCLMSKNFAKNYYDLYKNKIFDNGVVEVNFDSSVAKFNIPKYFLKLYRKEFGDENYLKFYNWRKNLRLNYLAYLNKFYKYVNKDFYWNEKAKELGYDDYLVEVSQQNKRLLQKILFDIYENRDYGV